MNQEFWDKRYGAEAYAYGTEPNDFLKSNITLLKPNSKILCLAEGEGRNAIYLAELEHNVTAIDYSQNGLDKLSQLASQKNVDVKTICKDLNEYQIQENSWDAIICIFGHFTESLRTKLLKQIYNGLKPNGNFIFEAYHKNQILYKTGGPQSDDLLYNPIDLLNDLYEFKIININCTVREVYEGEFHKGPSSVIQIIAIK